MRCPFCHGEDTQVKDSRPAEEGSVVRRRRQCAGCGARFTTFERVQLRNLTVVKRNGMHEPFDREKLARSIDVALRKRNMAPERIEQLTSGIVRRLESLGDATISTENIGGIVMSSLSRFDTVSYVRFASVYKNFQNADDFEALLAQLQPPADTD